MWKKITVLASSVAGLDNIAGSAMKDSTGQPIGERAKNFINALVGKTTGFNPIPNTPYNYHQQPYYIFATKGNESLDAAISLFVGQYKETTNVLLTTVDIKDIETGLITANFDAFTKHNNKNITKSFKITKSII